MDPTTLPSDISPDALWQQIRRQERQRQEEPIRTEPEDSEVASWKNVHALHASCEKGALLHLVEMMMSITYSSSGPLDRLQLRLSGYVSVVMFLVLACKCHFFPFHCGQVCFIVRCVFPGTPVGEFLHGAEQRACTREISQLGGSRFHKGVTPPISGQPLELALCGCFNSMLSVYIALLSWRVNGIIWYHLRECFCGSILLLRLILLSRTWTDVLSSRGLDPVPSCWVGSSLLISSTGGYFAL